MPAMTLASEMIGRRMGLPRALTRDILCERDLRATMDDGAVLLADRHVARTSAGRAQPTVLVRSPYGRRQFMGLMFGRLLAERGLQVVVQSVRGTFGSGGEFSPFDERPDGLATLRWLREQPWHSGRVGMIGPSYLGLVQWAVAAEAGEDLAALAIQVSASQFHGQTFAGGSLSLETAASWMVLVGAQERRLAPLAMARAIRGLPAALAEQPLGDLDARATGAEVPWFREALASRTREDSYWVARDFAAGVGSVAAPVQLVGGWYDIFLPWMLEDFAELQAAGRSPQAIIGPWTHTAPGLMRTGIGEGVRWLRSHLLGDRLAQRSAPLRVYLTGERTGGGWRELPAWPPPGTGERRLWLHDGGRLAEEQPPPEGSSDRYRYDPSDPTPSLGGPVLLAARPVVDNRALEARGDVLVYTTPVLAQTVEAIGPVTVELYVRAGAADFDIFARVCDVDPEGASWNVCDALARVPGEYDERRGDSVFVRFGLWPIGHRFAAGHRIRLQVSSGAHPRYARNPGTGEDLVTATDLRAVEIEILRDAGHPSVLILPRAGAAQNGGAEPA
jgi:putative CocE/NonD family hydrolase